MAKVKKMDGDNPKKWVKLTLSKREAAGVCALIGSDCAHMVPYDLFDELNGFFEDEATNWDRWGLKAIKSKETAEGLDDLFGGL